MSMRELVRPAGGLALPVTPQERQLGFLDRSLLLHHRHDIRECLAGVLQRAGGVDEGYMRRLGRALEEVPPDRAIGDAVHVPIDRLYRVVPVLFARSPTQSLCWSR